MDNIDKLIEEVNCLSSTQKNGYGFVLINNIGKIKEITKLEVCMRLVKKFAEVPKQDKDTVVEYSKAEFLETEKIQAYIYFIDVDIYSQVIECISDCPYRIGGFETFKIVNLENGIFTSEMMISLVQNLKEMMNGLTYDCLNGRLREPVLVKPFEIIFDKEFIDCDECAVCLENTKVKIKGCSHAICIKCWSNLKTNICPLCRQKIDFIEFNCDCDNDDEDDE